MFNSFVIAGFDCTHGRNVHGMPIKSRLTTQHSACLEDDYRMLVKLGIRTIRDGAPWPEVQSGPGRFDWSPLDAIVAAAERQQIDVIYDFCHFGVPEHVDLFSVEFVKQFAEFCYRATCRITARSRRPVLVTPLNEPSYYAWAAGQAALFPPYCRERAFELKVQLARAVLAGIDAIWAAAPSATIVNVDPICRTVAPTDRPDLHEAATRFNQVAVYESFDLISGRLLPELGGSMRHLGTVGINYYWTNQWEFGREDVPLLPDDPRAVPLSFLIDEVWQRYRVNIVVSESGHIGDGRAKWAQQMTADVMTTLERGIPLRGVCLYPIIGMHAWHEPETWLRMGLWDVADGKRVLHSAMLEALSELLDIGRNVVGGSSNGRPDGTTRRV